MIKNWLEAELNLKIQSKFESEKTGVYLMKAYFGLLFIMLVMLNGCGRNVDNHIKKDMDGLYQKSSDAQALYRQQEKKQHDILNASKTTHYSKEIDVDAVDQIVADSDYVWTVDVPVPLQASEKKNCYEASPTHYSIGYVTSLDHDALVAFYKQQMELFGWRQWWEIDGLEALLLFEKPNKHCAISIRSGDTRRKQDIIISQKIV